MSVNSRAQDYASKMLESAIQALSYVDGLTKEDFLADSRTEDAVVMKLLVIGELAAQLIENYPDFVKAHKEVPWPQMKGMRNRMAHGYFELDMEIVWETCQALPLLVSQLEQIVGS